MRMVMLAVAVFGLIAIVAWSSRWKATAQNDMSVLSSEQDAADAGIKPASTVQPVTRIDCGAEVVVLWDTYGKDYWACYVKTPSNQRGWVLCTSLQRVPPFFSPPNPSSRQTCAKSRAVR